MENTFRSPQSSEKKGGTSSQPQVGNTKFPTNHDRKTVRGKGSKYKVKNKTLDPALNNKFSPLQDEEKAQSKEEEILDQMGMTEKPMIKKEHKNKRNNRAIREKISRVVVGNETFITRGKNFDFEIVDLDFADQYFSFPYPVNTGNQADYAFLTTVLTFLPNYQMQKLLGLLNKPGVYTESDLIITVPENATDMILLSKSAKQSSFTDINSLYFYVANALLYHNNLLNMNELLTKRIIDNQIYWYLDKEYSIFKYDKGYTVKYFKSDGTIDSASLSFTTGNKYLRTLFSAVINIPATKHGEKIREKLDVAVDKFKAEIDDKMKVMHDVPIIDQIKPLPKEPETRKESNRYGYHFRKENLVIPAPYPLQEDINNLAKKKLADKLRLEARAELKRTELKMLEDKLHKSKFALNEKNFPLLRKLTATNIREDEVQVIQERIHILKRALKMPAPKTTLVETQNAKNRWMKDDKSLTIRDFKDRFQIEAHNILPVESVEIYLSWFTNEKRLPIKANRTNHMILNKVYSGDSAIKASQIVFDQILNALRHLPFPVKTLLYNKLLPNSSYYLYDFVRTYRRMLAEDGVKTYGKWKSLFKSSEDIDILNKQLVLYPVDSDSATALRRIKNITVGTTTASDLDKLRTDPKNTRYLRFDKESVPIILKEMEDPIVVKSLRLIAFEKDKESALADTKNLLFALKFYWNGRYVYISGKNNVKQFLKGLMDYSSQFDATHSGSFRDIRTFKMGVYYFKSQRLDGRRINYAEYTRMGLQPSTEILGSSGATRPHLDMMDDDDLKLLKESVMSNPELFKEVSNCRFGQLCEALKTTDIMSVQFGNDGEIYHAFKEYLGLLNRIDERAEEEKNTKDDDEEIPQEPKSEDYAADKSDDESSSKDNHDYRLSGDSQIFECSSDDSVREFREQENPAQDDQYDEEQGENMKILNKMADKLVKMHNRMQMEPAKISIVVKEKIVTQQFTSFTFSDYAFPFRSILAIQYNEDEMSADSEQEERPYVLNHEVDQFGEEWSLPNKNFVSTHYLAKNLIFPKSATDQDKKIHFATWALMSQRVVIAGNRIIRFKLDDVNPDVVISSWKLKSVSEEKLETKSDDDEEVTVFSSAENGDYTFNESCLPKLPEVSISCPKLSSCLKNTQTSSSPSRTFQRLEARAPNDDDSSTLLNKKSPPSKKGLIDTFFKRGRIDTAETQHLLGFYDGQGKAFTLTRRNYLYDMIDEYLAVDIAGRLYSIDDICKSSNATLKSNYVEKIFCKIRDNGDEKLSNSEMENQSNSMDFNLANLITFRNFYKEKYLIHLDGSTNQCGFLAVFISMVINKNASALGYLSKVGIFDIETSSIPNLKKFLAPIFGGKMPEYCTNDWIAMHSGQFNFSGLLTTYESESLFHAYYVVDEQQLASLTPERIMHHPLLIKVTPLNEHYENLQSIVEDSINMHYDSSRLLHMTLNDYYIMRYNQGLIDKKIIININDQLMHSLPRGKHTVWCLHIIESCVISCVYYLADVEVIRDDTEIPLEQKIIDFTLRHRHTGVEWEYPMNADNGVIAKNKSMIYNTNHNVYLTGRSTMYVGRLVPFPYGMLYGSFVKSNIKIDSLAALAELFGRWQIIGYHITDWLNLAPGVNLIAFRHCQPRFRFVYRWPTMFHPKPGCFSDIFWGRSTYLTQMGQMISNYSEQFVSAISQFMIYKLPTDSKCKSERFINDITARPEIVEAACKFISASLQQSFIPSISMYFLVYEMSLFSTSNAVVLHKETSIFFDYKQAMFQYIQNLFDHAIDKTFIKFHDFNDFEWARFLRTEYLQGAYTNIDKKCINDLQQLDQSKLRVLSDKSIDQLLSENKYSMEDFKLETKSSFRLAMDLDDSKCIPKFVAPTRVALIHAVFARQGYPTVYPDLKFIKQSGIYLRALKFSEELPTINEFCYVSRSDYLKSIENKKVAAYRRGFQIFDGAPVLINAFNVMIKNGEKCYATEMNKYDLKPRLICVPSFTVRAVLGHYMQWLQHNLIRNTSNHLEELPALHPMNGYVHGDSYNLLKRRVSTALAMFKDPVFISADSKRHDAHQSEAVLKIDMIIVLKYLAQFCAEQGYTFNHYQAMKKSLSTTVSNILYKDRINPDQVKMRFAFVGTVFSGHPERTTFGNTFRMLTIFNSMFEEMNIASPMQYMSFHSGDDILMIVERAEANRTILQMSKWFALGEDHMFEPHGVGMRISEVLVGNVGNFCSLNLVCDGPTLIDIKVCPSKSGLKASHSLNAGDTIPVRDYLRAIKIASDHTENPEDSIVYSHILEFNKLAYSDDKRYNMKRIEEVLNSYSYSFSMKGDLKTPIDAAYYAKDKLSAFVYSGCTPSQLLAQRANLLSNENPPGNMFNQINTIKSSPVRFTEILGMDNQASTIEKAKHRTKTFTQDYLKWYTKELKGQTKCSSYKEWCGSTLDARFKQARNAKKQIESEMRSELKVAKKKYKKKAKKQAEKFIKDNIPGGNLLMPLAKEMIKVVKKKKNNKKKNDSKSFFNIDTLGTRVRQDGLYCFSQFKRLFEDPLSGDRVCFPDGNRNRSLKMSFMDQAVFTTGTAGYGFFSMSPTAAVDLVTAWVTTSAYTLSTINPFVGAVNLTSMPAGVDTKMGPTIFGSGNLFQQTIAGHFNSIYRIVGVGLEITTSSNSGNTGGNIYIIETSGHEPTVTQTISDYSAFQQCRIVPFSELSGKSVKKLFLPIQPHMPYMWQEESDIARYHYYPWQDDQLGGISTNTAPQPCIIIGAVAQEVSQPIVVTIRYKMYVELYGNYVRSCDSPSDGTTALGGQLYELYNGYQAMFARDSDVKIAH